MIGMNCEVHILGTTLRERSSAVAYGLDAYLLPLLDPDGNQTYQTIWDTLVPKSSNDLSYELSSAADTEPVWEPGQSVSQRLTGFDVDTPERVYSRRQWISYASHPNGTYDRTADDWYPHDFQKMAVNKKYYCPRNSALLIGIANPDMGNDASLDRILPTGNIYDWAMLKYIDDTMRDMMRWLLGLSAQGSGTFQLDEAETFIEKIVADFAVVENAIWFAGFATVEVGMMANARIRVPGEMRVGVIGAGT